MSELCLRSSNNPPKKTKASEAFPRISEKRDFPRANLFTPSAGSPSSAKPCYAKYSDISSNPPAAKIQVTSTLAASASISDGFLPCNDTIRNAAISASILRFCTFVRHTEQRQADQPVIPHTYKIGEYTYPQQKAVQWNTVYFNLT